MEQEKNGDKKRSFWDAVYDGTEKLIRSAKDLAKLAIALVLFAALAIGLYELHGLFSPTKREEANQKQAETLKEEYERGYEAGKDSQEYTDAEKWLVDGVSLREIYDRVWDEYGMTPNDAYRTIDDYTSYQDHGDVTWEDYQIALEVVLRTASLMPYQ